MNIDPEIQEGLDLFYSAPIVAFDPPGSQLVVDEKGEYSVQSTPPWVKFSTGFAEVLPKLKGAKLSVYICICLHVNKDGKSWPGFRTICRETGLGTKAVSRAVSELEQIPGLLEISKRASEKGTNIYKPTFVAYGRENTPKSSTPQKESGLPPKRKAAVPPKRKAEVEPYKESKESDGQTAARPRDALFDAICQVCGIDSTIDGNGKAVGGVINALLSAKPPYTPDEVLAYGRSVSWKSNKPNVWKLKQEIGAIRQNGHSINVHPGTPDADALIAGSPEANAYFAKLDPRV